MASKKTQPGSDHTKERYQECYAKVLLERCVPEYRNGIELQDRPDLYCCGCDTGIEVTGIIGKERSEALRLLQRLRDVPDDVRRRRIERLIQLGVEFSHGTPILPMISYRDGLDSKPYLDLYAAIKKKLKKLNSKGFKQYSKNALLVFSELMFLWGDQYKIVDRLRDCQEDFETKFDTIYIVTHYKLMRYDMDSNGPIEWFFDERAVHNIAVKMAREGKTNE